MRKIMLLLVLMVMGRAMSGQARSLGGLAISGSGQATGGVTLALSTSGFQFTPLIGSLIQTGTAGIHATPLPPQGINVSVALRNHTAQGITLVLGVTATPASPSFEFRVFNSNGVLVWDSLGNITIPISKVAILKPGQALRGTAFVPLFINGMALPAGTYTLVASLYGTPAFSTTASFVVNNVIAIN